MSFDINQLNEADFDFLTSFAYNVLTNNVEFLPAFTDNEKIIQTIKEALFNDNEDYETLLVANEPNLEIWDDLRENLPDLFEDEEEEEQVLEEKAQVQLDLVLFPKDSDIEEQAILVGTDESEAITIAAILINLNVTENFASTTKPFRNVHINWLPYK